MSPKFDRTCLKGLWTRHGLLVALVFTNVWWGMGCGPEAPFVRYSGTTLPNVTRYESLVVSRTAPPDRPYIEMGTIAVGCPTNAQVGMFGSIEVEGGCQYDHAVAMAARKAALIGADGIYGIVTAAAANGTLASLVASAFKFKPSDHAVAVPGKPPEHSAMLPSPVPLAAPTTPSVEDRLRQMKDLRDKGLITPDDYEKRKAEILKQL